MKSCLRPTDKEVEFFSFVVGDSVEFFYRILVSLDSCPYRSGGFASFYIKINRLLEIHEYLSNSKGMSKMKESLM